MPTRPLTSLPLDDHACRECGGTGRIIDTHRDSYAPGAMQSRPCDACRPYRAAVSLKSSAQELDAYLDANPALAAEHAAYVRQLLFTVVAAVLIGTVAAGWIDAAITMQIREVL